MTEMQPDLRETVTGPVGVMSRPYYCKIMWMFSERYPEGIELGPGECMGKKRKGTSVIGRKERC